MGTGVVLLRPALAHSGTISPPASPTPTVVPVTSDTAAGACDPEDGVEQYGAAMETTLLSADAGEDTTLKRGETLDLRGEQPEQPEVSSAVALRRETTLLEPEESCARAAAASLSCTRSALGVTALILPQEEAVDRAACLLEGTLSSPLATHGCSATWVRGELLGQGSLGTVFSALDQKTGQLMAVKEMFVDPSNEKDVSLREALEQEVTVLKGLEHPRIVSYLGHDYIDDCLYIYLEYMPGGSLASVLGQFGPLDESLIQVYTRELLEGLDYLHTRQPPVVHRDIKGANVLVGLKCEVKLSDFGCSKRSVDTLSKTMKGSIPWMAPEVINHNGYGRLADVWSFGCVIIEMVTAKRPWGHFDNAMAAWFRIAMSDETPPVPDTLSAQCQDFIGCCLRRDSVVRLSASELLLHDFVNGLPCDEVSGRRTSRDDLRNDPSFDSIQRLLSDCMD